MAGTTSSACVDGLPATRSPRGARDDFATVQHRRRSAKRGIRLAWPQDMPWAMRRAVASQAVADLAYELSNLRKPARPPSDFLPDAA